MNKANLKLSIVIAVGLGLAMIIPISLVAQDTFDIGDYIFSPEEHAQFQSPDGLVTATLVVNQESIENAPTSVGLLTAEPGAAVPRHTHEDSVEILYLLEGGGTMEMGTQTVTLSAGETIYVPIGVEHNYTNDTDTRMVAVQVYTTAGPEARFRNWEAVQ